MKYAQGEVSLELKELLKAKLSKAKTESDLDVVLNEIHDAVLECRNNKKWQVLNIEPLVS